MLQHEKRMINSAKEQELHKLHTKFDTAKTEYKIHIAKTLRFYILKHLRNNIMANNNKEEP